MFSVNIGKWKTIYKDGEKTEGSLTINGYENEIIYRLTENPTNYDAYLIYNIDNYNIELRVERAKDADVLNALSELTVSLGGVNGETTIAKDLKLVLTNNKIEKKYLGIDSVDGGHKIDLSNKFNGISALTLDINSCEYSYIDQNGETQTINTIENPLFTYNQDDKTIQFYHVGQFTSGYINFDVKSGGYKFDEMVYEFGVNLNIVIVVNGEDINENLE